MTKYVLSGYIGFDNFGDEAIASVVVKHLKNNGAEKITLISSNPDKTSVLYDVDSVSLLKFIKPIMESDVLISGGGSLLQDITSLKSLIYYLTVISCAIFFGKKVIIFAQGFTPFRTQIGKFLTSMVLKMCSNITVRDIKSQNLLTEMGVSSELVADPVFGMEVNNTKHSGIGVQLRGFETLTEEFLDKLALEIKQRFGEEEIKLFSMQDSIDLPVLERFSQKGINAKIIKSLPVEDEIKALSELEYLIGMRFHACLIAARASVKVLGINYDIKVKTLADNIGFPILELNQKNLTNEFDELVNLNTQNYSIPQFHFPNL